MELNWTDYTPVLEAGHTTGYFELPAFEVNNIDWKEASEIVRQYNYSATKNFALRRVIKPADANYVLCIRYRIGDAVTRYKLWDDVNLQLPNVELYAGQVIKKNFCLEIWNLNGEATASQDTAFRVRSGIRRTVTDFTSLPVEHSDAVGAAAPNLFAPAAPILNPVTMIPGVPPRLWLKADTGVTLDTGTNINQWDDQSGNGYNLTWNAIRPVLANGSFGEKLGSAIKFTAGGKLQNLAAPNPTWSRYYIAMKVVNHLDLKNILNDGSQDTRLDAGGIQSTFGAVTVGVFYPPEPFIIRLDNRPGPNITFMHRIQSVSLDDIGTLFQLDEFDTGLFNNITPTQMILGGAAGAYEFHIAEILTYHAFLTDAQDAIIKAYLAQRYYVASAALPISFDSGSAWLDNT